MLVIFKQEVLLFHLLVSSVLAALRTMLLKLNLALNKLFILTRIIIRKITF